MLLQVGVFAKLSRNMIKFFEDFQTIEPRLKGLKEIDTMGGLITALKEVVPKNGESAEIDGYELTVVSGDNRRIKELVVKKLY